MSGFVKIAIDDYYSDSNWSTIIHKYWSLAERVSDPRVQGWYFFDTPLPTLFMVWAYLGFVMVFGPIWMSSRKPFNLQKTLVAYNAFQVFLSAYMFYEHLMSGWWGDYSVACQPVDYSNSDKANRMLTLCWIYYFSKISEFADTVFFVLRKKKSQITWLHLYHHSLTPFEAWILVKFIAGGHGTFSNIVNNLVHVIMYAYYMIAAMGPQYQKYVWWKKHLTHIQLVQFFMVLFHSVSALIYDCGYPKLIAAGLILHSTIFIVLFMNFYIQSYKKLSKPNSSKVTFDGAIKENNNNHSEEKKVVDQEDVNTSNELKNGITKRHLNGYINGHITNGHILNGLNTNAHILNGHQGTIGQTTNGHLSNGHVENGQISNGHKSNGIASNGYNNNGKTSSHIFNGKSRAKDL